MTKKETKREKKIAGTETAVCPLCNTVFNKRRSSQKICRTNHEVKCFGCGKEFILGRYYPGRNNYSCGEKACRQKLSEHTNKEKYGVTNPAKAKAVREKISKKRNSRTPEQKANELMKQRATMIERYGVEHPLQSQELKERARETNRERYGVDNPAKADEIKKKTKDSNLRKYGVSSTSKLASVKAKAKRTKIERYGTDDLIHKSEFHKRRYEKTNLQRYGVKNPAQAKEIKEKIKKTNLEKYGVEWSTQSKETQKKMKESLIERYGVDNPGKSKEIIARANEKSSETRIKKSFINEKDKNLIFNELEKSYLNKKNIPRENLDKHFQSIPLNKVNLASFFKITPHSMNRVLKKNNLEEYFRTPLSNKELSLLNYLKEKHPEVNFRYNDRKVLNGQELDFYFPDQKIAVEISPTSTHNSLSVAFNQEPKGRTYHKDKFIKCSELGVELITVFDWHPWENILELISSKLNNHNKRVPARKTVYKEHNHITKELFTRLSTWHTLSLPSNFKRKNDVSTLSYNGEIIGLALWTSTKDDFTKELKRMVFKPGVSVIGGPSKLLKNYLKNHKNIKNITTFSDCDLGQGLTYEKIGFTLIEESKPTLTYWSDKHKKKIKYTSLVMQGADRLLRTVPGYNHVGRNSSLTNTDIVLAYGFLPVYDCGYRKWILRKDNK